MKKSKVSDCNILSLPQIHNLAGNITAIENNVQIPFEIKRTYFLYDVPAKSERGGHAHRELHQLIVAVSGSFDVVLDDGKNKVIHTLRYPNEGLLIVPGIWRELVNFSSGSICLVLASEIYLEKDYIRNYKKFKKWKLKV